MAFDAGPRFGSTPSPPPEKRTAQDVLDFVLRAAVLLPLLGLYTWWALSAMWNAVKVGFGL